MASNKFTKSTRFSALYMDDDVPMKSKPARSIKLPSFSPCFKKKKPVMDWSVVKKEGNSVMLRKNSKSPSQTEQSLKYKDIEPKFNYKALEKFNKYEEEREEEANKEMFEAMGHDEYNRWIRNEEELDELNDYYDNIDEYEDEDYSHGSD